MLQVLLLAVGGLIGLWFICRCLTWLLCSIVRRVSGVDMVIGKVGFFTVGQLSLNFKNGVSLEIERLWLSSSFINNEIRKPLAICMGGTRIQLNVQDKLLKSRSNEATTTATALPSAFSYLQFLGFIMDNVHAIVVRGTLPGCIAQFTIHEVTCDWTIDHTRADVCLDLLLHVSNATSRLLLDGTATPCIAEVNMSAGFYFRVEMVTSRVQVARLTAEKPSVWITEDLLKILDDRKFSVDHAPEQPAFQEATPRKSPSDIFKKFPDEVYLQLEDTYFAIVKEALNRKLGLKIKDTLLRFTKSTSDKANPRPAILLTIKDVTAGSAQVSLASLTELTSTLKIDEQAINIRSKILNCFLGYHQEEFQYWSSMIPRTKPRDDLPVLELRPVSPTAHTSKSPPPPDSRSLLAHLVGARVVSVTTEVDRSTLSLATASCTGLNGSLDEAKLTMSFKLDHKGEGADIRCEMEVMGLSCMLADARLRTDNLTSKQHQWGTVLHLGILISKIRCLSNDVTIDTMLDSVQVEWSSALAHVITQIVNAVNRGRHRADSQTDATPPRHPAARPARPPGGAPTPVTVSRVNLQCSSINGFICNELKVGTMMRMDTFAVQHRAGELSAKFDGTKIVYFTQQRTSYPLVRSHEIHGYNAHLKHLVMQCSITMHRMNVELMEEIYFVWKTSLHMCIFTAISEANDVLNLLKGSTEENPEPDSQRGSPSSLQVALAVRANCMVALQLSKKHRLSFSVPELKFELKPRKTSVTVPQASISFDDHEIFTLESVSVCSIHHSEQIQLDREGFGCLKLSTNCAWGITFERVTCVFPHQYVFASCFEDIKRLNKWRKLVHKVARKPFTADSPLPPDLVIKINNLIVQLNDDPFEVKLSDNYELLSDESLENQKRFSAMDKRIQDLRKKYGLLPASKIDELYNSLSRKAAEVYVQRSRQLYVASPRRTKLFTWAFTNLEVTALADPSLHGTDNVISHIKNIDKDSPYPEEGLEFVTLWCRMINVSAETWECSLKDFPMPLLDIQDLHVWGRLACAEQTSAARARVSLKVEVEQPWGDTTVERSLLPLKFYHDFSCDVSKWNMAYGPCWEPSIAQYNQSMNLINRPSIDPSVPLPFWDKARLFLHGRLTMSVVKMRWLYHVSLDPYNTTELMDWTWSGLVLDWTNAKWVLQGDLDVYARTASKYDDCNLLHLPNLRFCIVLKWLCRGDANDHHSVMPCAPDKVPEYSHQDHDSYRAFRSDNLNMSVSFETKPGDNPDNLPRCLFYGSTLRWMDKIKMCFSRVSKPIRRGKYFGVIVPRKPQLSRHLKDMELSTRLHGFQVQYWVSFALQHGGEMKCGELCLAIGAHLDIMLAEDGLVRRATASWSVRQFLVQLSSTTVWLVSSSSDGEEGISLRGPVNKSYFLSLEKVVYQRDDATNPTETESVPPSPGQIEERSKHRMQIFELKGAWTPSNRNIAFSLYDGYIKAQTLKKNLSSDALKGFKVDSSATQTPAKNRSMSVTSPTTLCSGVMATPSPASKMPAFFMLQKLVSEADSRFVAVHEEVSGGNVHVEQLHGIQACQQEDVLHRNWHIELYNSQVMLRGMETNGYVIVSAGKASILSSEHQPVWRDRQPRSKTTWIGTLEFMQYYATVDADPTIANEHILWLTKENIEHVEDVTDSAGLAGMPEMIGSGQSVGGVVTDHIPKEQGGSGVQLQRIISRCKCQFFYAHFGEADRETYPEIPAPPTGDSDMMKQEEGINSFTLFHHDLNICTNSLQYAMILDLVNNLLLYVEPRKKVANGKLQKMRFQLQLSSGEDQRKPILHQQNTLRQLLSNMRRLERELYMVHKALEDDQQNPELLEQSHELEVGLYNLKTQTTALSAELAIMVSCFKENLLQLKTRKAAKDQKTSAIVRRNEVCFKHAEWRMTEMDGQIGIADLMLRNFLYSKVNRTDDSGSHQLELGWVKATNLLPNTLYKDVLNPQDMGRGQSDRQMALRILCKFKGPVGGIPVYEHFEVNVVPITIQLTYRFYKTVMAFFFPGRNIDVDDNQSEDGDNVSEASVPPTPIVPPKTRIKKTSIKQKVMSRTEDDDIIKMKERASQNNIFLFIKIPEVPMRLSYKGSKEKNIEDLYDLSLLLPTLEYHNETWTWLDFLLAVKKDSKRILIQQAIKQKLHVRSRAAPGEEHPKSEGRQEEDKVKMLLGAKLLSGGDKPHSKKSLFGKSNTK